MSDRSVGALLEFLTWQRDKGLGSSSTLSAKKAAANKVLGILDEQEAQDVTIIDIDNVMMRFANLEGKGYTPDSMATYKSRVISAISDFKTYLNDPAGYKPGKGTPGRKAKEKQSSATKFDNIGKKSDGNDRGGDLSPSSRRVIKVPIPLRDGHLVWLENVPTDLTVQEAEKIAEVAKAMALSAE